MQKKSFLDLSSGYVSRARDQLPLQGEEGPWKLNQSYVKDWLSMKLSSFGAKELTYDK